MRNFYFHGSLSKKNHHELEVELEKQFKAWGLKSWKWYKIMVLVMISLTIIGICITWYFWHSDVNKNFKKLEKNYLETNKMTDWYNNNLKKVKGKFNNDDVNLKRFINKFSLPNFFFENETIKSYTPGFYRWPPYGKSYYYNLSLEGTFKKYLFNIGTVTVITRVKTGRGDSVTYSSYHIITFTAPNCQITNKLSKEKKIDFIAKKKSSDYGLESEEFEKKFKFKNYENPILIRKFFEPRIMEKILNACYDQGITPKIILRPNQIAINFKQNVITDRPLFNFKCAPLVKKFARHNAKVLSTSLTALKLGLEWVWTFF